MPEQANISEEAEDTKPEKRKIQLELDGTDFQGFSLRMLGVVGISLLVKWLSGLDGFLIFISVTACWLVFFIYKITRFKEEAYQQIIDDLEERNQILDKSNQLLKNAVQDSLGMRVSTKAKPSSEKEP